MRALPPTLRYPAWSAGGRVWYSVSAGQRRAALDNYAAVLGLPRDHPDVSRTARAAFRNYGQMLADFLLIGSLETGEMSAQLGLDGREHVDRALAAGRGTILALPHMGSWDFAASLAILLGYRLLAVGETFPGSLNEAVVETRSAHGMELVPLGRSAVRWINRSLEANYMVALLCDLPPATGGVEVRFFGRRAVVPGGPASFALKRGVSILPVFSRRDGPGHYHIHVDPPVEMSVEAPTGEAVRVIMQRVIERFEAFITAYPEQWYAFKPVLT